MEQVRWVKVLSEAAERERVAEEEEWVAVWRQVLLDSVYARNVVQKFLTSKAYLVLRLTVLNAEPKWSEDNNRKTEGYY